MANKSIAMLLVLVMSMGAMATVLGSTGPGGQPNEDTTGHPSISSSPISDISAIADERKSMLTYLSGLDSSGPSFPLTPSPGEPIATGGDIGPPDRTDAVFLYQDPDTHSWLPIPSTDDLNEGRMAPVSFENGSAIEVHGKLFEDIFHENITYLDDIGINTVPISVEFDGTPVAMSSNMTGNATAMVDPFFGTGNGTFQFPLDIIRPAGEYQLVLHFAGWPLVGQPVYPSLTYRATVHVNHPTVIDVDVSPDPVRVGYNGTISGTIADDTGRMITSIPLQIWFDGQLLGPTSEGVYIDNVEVRGTAFTDDFEASGDGGWSAYSAPDRWADIQWEHGTPAEGTRPVPLPPGNRVWGTVLDDMYQRGAWSFLVSPSVDLSGDGPYSLTFRAWWSLYWDEDLAYVLVSDDGGTTWDEDNPMVFTDLGLTSDSWRFLKFDLADHSGSDDVRLAFVFYSPDKTLNVDTTSAFEFIHKVPLDAEAGHHEVVVGFNGNLFYQAAEVAEDIIVKRIARFEFEPGTENKTGYRNKPLVLWARIVDNMGEVLREHVDGARQHYAVTIYWNRQMTIGGDLEWRVGPAVVPDPETGEVLAWFTVDPDEELGPANVTFRFPGSDFYTSIQMTDVYDVKAHLYVTVPPRQDRSFYRGQSVDLGAELRVMPSESIDTIEPGDLVIGEFVKIYWNGQQIATRRDSGNPFDEEYLVNSDHPLGPVNVTFEYDGSSIYEPFVQQVTYYVISHTSITLMDQVVTKGTWVYINGKVLDDKGQPVPNVPVYIIWKRAPEIGRATTKADGTFSLQYYIEYEDRVGNISVIARFKGTKIYLANETTATYTVKVNTVLERRDRTFNIIRGQQVQVSAKLYEDWGGYRAVEIQRQVVALIIDGVVVATKLTAFDGSVTFNVPIDLDIFKGGYVNLVMAFNGTDFYHLSINTTTVFIRSDYLITMNMDVNGRPFDQFEDVARYRDTVHAWVIVQDSEFEPVADVDISFFIVRDDLGGTKRLILTGKTNENGSQGFYRMLLDEKGGKISFKVQVPGVLTDLSYPIMYIVPPPPTAEDIIETIGDRDVTVGSELDLKVQVRNKGNWNTGELTITLVSAPVWMDISQDGTIKGSPSEDDVGEHLVTVWLYDGERSETTHILITVRERSTLPFGTALTMAIIMLVIIVPSVVLLIRSERARNRQ